MLRAKKLMKRLRLKRFNKGVQTDTVKLETHKKEASTTTSTNETLVV